jgi:hypothetical protein
VACCAFVAFLLSQLYIMGRGLKRLVGRGQHLDVDAATLWRLSTHLEPATAEPVAKEDVRRRSQLKRAGLFVALLAEIAIVVIGSHWLIIGDGVSQVALEIQHLTSGHALEHLRHLFD